MRAALMMMAALAVSAQAQTVQTTQMASGLASPVYVTHVPGDYSRLFIVEKQSGGIGRIRILNLNSGVLLATPFLTISPVATGSEQGLLGLAFHPDYASNGLFYVNYNPNSATTVIEEYTVSASPDKADAGSARTILSFAQPFANHNGGWLGFGLDGFLYISTGDGGSGNDPGNRAQDITNQLLGKMLRIDVDGDDFPADANRNYAIPPTNPFVGVTGDDEIYAYGLRNPWRCAFDSATGHLFIGDVGQDAVEEIDVIPSGTGGLNFGWRCMEGTNCTGLTGCTCNVSLTLPIDQYSHGTNPCSGSVTGGEVYRGCSMPALDGTYFYADYCKDRVWSFRYVNGSVLDKAERTSEIGLTNISSFGTDAFGEMYICSLNGTVSRIDPVGGIADCNTNNIDDACDIVAGTLTDYDGNGMPDQCEPAGCSEADVTTQGAGVGAPGYGIPDGTITGADINFYVNFWIALSPLADLTTQGAGAGDPGFGEPDGLVTGADINYYVNIWLANCP